MKKQQEHPWRREKKIDLASKEYVKMRSDIFNKIEDDVVLSCMPADLSGTKVLDYGCAGGYFSLLCARRGADTVGIDILPRAIKISKDLLRREGLESKGRFYVAGHPRELEGRESFDFIILKDILEHVDNDSSLLEDCLPLLKEEGKIIITTPNFFSLNYLLQVKLLHQFILKEKNYIGWDPEHKRIYSLFSLKRLIERCGYDVITAKGMYLIPWGLIGMFRKRGTLLSSLGRILLLLDGWFMNVPFNAYLGWNMILLCQKSLEKQSSKGK